MRTRFDTILDARKSDEFTRAGWWTGQSLIQVFDHAVQRTPEKVAIVSGQTRWTYADLARQADQVARGLRARGVGKGDVVSIQLPNCPEFVAIHLAATRIGAVTNPLLHNYRASELSYILKFARSVAAFIPDQYRKLDFPAMYAGLREHLPDLSHVFVVGGAGAGSCECYESLLERCDGAAIATEPFDGNDISALIFTSGTESRPKGVMHSHNTLMYSTVQMAKLLHLTADDVIWTPSPIGHGTGFQWGVRQALTIGGTVVLQDVWNADDALRLIAAERCTYTLSATPFAAMLLESPLLGSVDTSSFRIFACAGAAIPAQLGAGVRDRIGCKLIGMWGMSECFVGSASSPEDSEARRWGTDGRAMPGVDLAIFDECRDRILPFGEVGELATRGPHLALGYFNEAKRTRETFRDDGWLFSNDLAVMNADGHVRLVGRKKEIVNRGGLKISVREMEDALAAHPGILSVAIVGVPDKLLGEKSCAFVVTRGKQNLDLSELNDFLQLRGVAKYKFPEYLVLLDHLPMTPTGKVQKFALREDFAAGRNEVATR